MFTAEQSLIKEVIQNYPDLGSRLWLTLKYRAGQMRPESFIRLFKGWQPGSILDLGTGYGLLANYLSLRYPQAQVVGIDLNLRCIEAAKATIKWRRNIRFRHQDILSLELEEGPWDCIVMVDVLQFVGRRDQQPLIEKSWQLLNPGGRLLMRENDPVFRLKSLNVYASNVLFHRKFSHFRSTEELRAMLGGAGYGLLEVYRSYPQSCILPFVTYLAYKAPFPKKLS